MPRFEKITFFEKKMSTQAANVKALCIAKGCSVEEPYPGIVIIRDFDKQILSNNTMTLLEDLDERLPIVGAGDSISEGTLQWVTGENINLKYRGNVLPRRKVWIQDGPTDKSINVYSYTGWNNCVALATSDWNKDTALKTICDKYNSFLSSCDIAQSNHAIITAYNNKDHNIGMHYDKTRSLKNDGVIAVVKMGASRRFSIRKRIIDAQSDKSFVQKMQENEPMLFDELVPSGTCILMTMEANLATQHGVLEMDEEVGLSGSIVFRTVKDVRSVQDLKAKAEKLEDARVQKADNKRKRED